jgi:hypothetical protein
MSSDLTPSELAALTVHLSSERLHPFQSITGSAGAAIELHRQMIHASTALMAVIAIVEIATRNITCEILSAKFNAPRWLEQPPAPFKWENSEEHKIKDAIRNARRAEYAKLTQTQKRSLDQLAFPNGFPSGLSHEDRVRQRRNKISVSPGQIIAHTTMFFWKRIYSSDYEHTLWKTSLKRAFPDKNISRSMVADAMEKIYQARNRIAHHDSFYGKKQSIQYMPCNSWSIISEIALYLGRLRRLN